VSGTNPIATFIYPTSSIMILGKKTLSITLRNVTLSTRCAIMLSALFVLLLATRKIVFITVAPDGDGNVGVGQLCQELLSADIHVRNLAGEVADDGSPENLGHRAKP